MDPLKPSLPAVPPPTAQSSETDTKTQPQGVPPPYEYAVQYSTRRKEQMPKASGGAESLLVGRLERARLESQSTTATSSASPPYRSFESEQSQKIWKNTRADISVAALCLASYFELPKSDRATTVAQHMICYVAKLLDQLDKDICSWCESDKALASLRKDFRKLCDKLKPVLMDKLAQDMIKNRSGKYPQIGKSFLISGSSPGVRNTEVFFWDSKQDARNSSMISLLDALLAMESERQDRCCNQLCDWAIQNLNQTDYNLLPCQEMARALWKDFCSKREVKDLLEKLNESARSGNKHAQAILTKLNQTTPLPAETNPYLMSRSQVSGSHLISSVMKLMQMLADDNLHAFDTDISPRGIAAINFRGSSLYVCCGSNNATNSKERRTARSQCLEAILQSSCSLILYQQKELPIKSSAKEQTIKLAKPFKVGKHTSGEYQVNINPDTLAETVTDGVITSVKFDCDISSGKRQQSSKLIALTGLQYPSGFSREFNSEIPLSLFVCKQVMIQFREWSLGQSMPMIYTPDDPQRAASIAVLALMATVPANVSLLTLVRAVNEAFKRRILSMAEVAKLAILCEDQGRPILD